MVDDEGGVETLSCSQRGSIEGAELWYECVMDWETG